MDSSAYWVSVCLTVAIRAVLTVSGEEGVVAEFERGGLESLWYGRAGAEDVTDRPAQRAFDSPAQVELTLWYLVSSSQVYNVACLCALSYMSFEKIARKTRNPIN